ncbi:unnamed protein product [Strongylus vulgaris]|uniref:Homeobox domain-containing protein n=1 Tax=Strongylus vulgaris TaxID=40348 RepID=A0A3P7JDU3_STRVU|nr:unnamed protein product [Strongylus vulgaris]
MLTGIASSQWSLFAKAHSGRYTISNTPHTTHHGLVPTPIMTSFLPSFHFGGKRKRRHRTIFSEEQLQVLEATFTETHYPDVSLREKLAIQCDLKEERVEVGLSTYYTSQFDFYSLFYHLFLPLPHSPLFCAIHKGKNLQILTKLAADLVSLFAFFSFLAFEEGITFFAHSLALSVTVAESEWEIVQMVICAVAKRRSRS